MARVAIELANGGRYQAACRVESCTHGWDGTPWRGEARWSLRFARWDQADHRDLHGGAA